MVDLFQTDQSTFLKNHTFSPLESNKIIVDGRSVLAQTQLLSKYHTFLPFREQRMNC